MRRSPAAPSSLVRPKAFYFLYFAAAASLLPFLSLYYESLGLSGRQIGLLIGVVPLVTLVSAPLWSGLADATRKHRLALLLAIAGAWAAVLALSWGATFRELAPMVMIYAFFVAPIVPLMDNSALALLAGRQAEYGKLRLWGGVGWGVAATLLGPLLQRAGLQWAFYSFLLFMFIAFLVAWRLPVWPSTAHQAYRAGLGRLLANPGFLLLLSIALVYGMSLAIFLNYLFLYLADLGAGRTLMALSLTVSTASELPLWFMADRLLRRLGVDWMLILSLLATAVRAFACALIPGGEGAWLVLPISLLHGPSFAVMWSAGVACANAVAPPGLAATAQGMFAGTLMGLGAALGALAGGALYDAIGPTALFRVVGWVLLIALVFRLGALSTFSRR